MTYEIMERTGKTAEAFFADQAKKIYSPNATHDPRYTWEEILPVPSEGLSGYRLTGCAHMARTPEGACVTCGAPRADK